MTDPEELLDGTVAEVKDGLDDYDGDIDELIAAEEAGKDRVTLLDHLRSLKDDREEGEEPPDTTSPGGGSGGSMRSIKDSIESRLDEDGGQDGDTDFSEDMDLAEAPEGFIRTGIDGLDAMFTHGIPKGSPVLLAGGSGSGKTILGLQSLAHHANNGKKCFFMSFEESREALISHMEDFGWDAEQMIEDDRLRIKKFSPFDITRKVEAALAAEKGELMIDIDPVILPEDFDPDIVVVDSLTAVASAFTEEDSSYRIYIDQLFSFFEDEDVTSFMITETDQEPEQFSPTGVEEFLADGVIVLYNFRRGDVRESAIEILKMRGEKHEKKIVALQISDDGITVYPDQQVFSAME